MDKKVILEDPIQREKFLIQKVDFSFFCRENVLLKR